MDLNKLFSKASKKEQKSKSILSDKYLKFLTIKKTRTHEKQYASYIHTSLYVWMWTKKIPNQINTKNHPQCALINGNCSVQVLNNLYSTAAATAYGFCPVIKLFKRLLRLAFCRHLTSIVCSQLESIRPFSVFSKTNDFVFFFYIFCLLLYEYHNVLVCI